MIRFVAVLTLAVLTGVTIHCKGPHRTAPGPEMTDNVTSTTN